MLMNMLIEKMNKFSLFVFYVHIFITYDHLLLLPLYTYLNVWFVAFLWVYNIRLIKTYVVRLNYEYGALLAQEPKENL